MWFLMIMATSATECGKQEKTNNYYRMVRGDRIFIPTNSNFSEIKVNNESFDDFNKQYGEQIKLEMEDPQKALQIQWNKESNIKDLTTNNYLNGNLTTTCYYILYAQDSSDYIYATSNLSELKQITKSEQLNQTKRINLTNILKMPVDCSFLTSQQYYNTFILFCLQSSTNSESGQNQYFLKFFNINCDNNLTTEIEKKLINYQLNSTNEGPFPNATGFELRYFQNVSLNQKQEFLIKLRLQDILNPLYYSTCVLYNLTQPQDQYDGIDCSPNGTQGNNILTDIMFVASNDSTLMLAYTRSSSGFNFIHINQTKRFMYPDQDLKTCDNDIYYGISINRQNNFSQIVKANNYLDISILSKYYITEIRVHLLELQEKIQFKMQRSKSDELFYNRFYSDESYYYLFSQNRVVYIEKKKDSTEININQTGILVDKSQPFRLFDVNDFKSLLLSKYFLTYDTVNQILYQQPMFFNYSLKIEISQKANESNFTNFVIKLRQDEPEIVLQITTLNNSNITCKSSQNFPNIDQQTCTYPLLYSCQGNGLSYEQQENSRYVADSVKLKSYENFDITTFMTPLVQRKERQLFQQQSIFSQIDKDYLYLVYQYNATESILISFQFNHTSQIYEKRKQKNLNHTCGNLYNFDIIQNNLNIVYQCASLEYEHIVVQTVPEDWPLSQFQFNETTAKDILNQTLNDTHIEEYSITNIIQFSHPYYLNNFFLVNIKMGNEIRNYLIINEINSFNISNSSYEIIILGNEAKNISLTKVELSILDSSLVVISSQTNIYYGNLPTFEFSQNYTEKKQLLLKEFKLDGDLKINCTVDFKTIDFKKYRANMPPGMLVFQFCNGDANQKVNETETARVYLLQNLTNKVQNDEDQLYNPSRALDLDLLKLVGAQTSLQKLLANQTFNINISNKSQDDCPQFIEFRKKGSLFDYRVIDYYLYVISSNSTDNSQLTILIYNMIDFSVRKVEISEIQKRLWVLPKNYTYIPNNNYEKQVTQNYSVIQLSGMPSLQNNCEGYFSWNDSFMRTYFSSHIEFQSHLSSQKVYKAQVIAFDITNQQNKSFQIIADFEQKDPFLQINIRSEEDQLISSRKQNFLVDDSIIVGNIETLNLSTSSITKYLEPANNNYYPTIERLIDYEIFGNFIIYIEKGDQLAEIQFVCINFLNNASNKSRLLTPNSQDCTFSILDDQLLHSDNQTEYSVSIFMVCKQRVEQLINTFRIFNLSLPDCQVTEIYINQSTTQVDLNKQNIWPSDQVRFVNKKLAFCQRFTLMGLEDSILKISNDTNHVTIAPYAGNNSEFYQINATSFNCQIQHMAATDQSISVIFSDFENQVWRWKSDEKQTLQLLFKDPHKGVQVLDESNLIIRFDNYFSKFSIRDIQCVNQTQSDFHQQFECLLDRKKSVNFSHSNDMPPLFNMPIIVLNDSFFIQLCKKKKKTVRSYTQLFTDCMITKQHKMNKN